MLMKQYRFQLLCYYFTSLLFRIAMGRRFSAGIRPKWVMWVILSASLVHASVAGCNFTAIFNFGDSNSDTGGFWAAFPAEGGPFGMTYFKKPVGRASDGRLIVDFFAQSLGLPFLSPYLQSMGSNFRQGANYATLASTVLMPEKCLFDGGLSPFFLAIQLNQMKEFKAKVIELHPRDNLPPLDIFSQSLYTFDIGQNDFTSKLANIGIDGVKKFLPEVVNNIVETVKALYAEGGRTFLVFNLRPIGCYPAFLAELPYNSSDLDKYGCLISYNNAVVDYNTMLKVKLNQTRSLLPDTSLIYVDIHSVTLELYQHPAQHGLLYGTKSCCGHGGGAYNFDPQLYCGNTKVINGTNVTATACGDPQNYVSWDGIHASEAANKLVTSAILSGSYFDPPFPLSKLCDLQPIG